MERTTKKTLGKMIGEMLQVNNLNANQMQIIDLLCQINESDEIALMSLKILLWKTPMKSGADLMHVKRLIKTVESLNLCF